MAAGSDADGANTAPAKRKAPAKPASPAQLAATLRQTFGTTSVILALLVGVPDIAMTADEAQSIADPAARLLAHSKLIKRLSGKIASSGDWLDLIFASAMYGLRVYPAILAKLQENAARERSRRASHDRPLYQQPNVAASQSDSHVGGSGAGRAAASTGANGTHGLDGLFTWTPGAEPLEGWATGYAG